MLELSLPWNLLPADTFQVPGEKQKPFKSGHFGTHLDRLLGSEVPLGYF